MCVCYENTKNIVLQNETKAGTQLSLCVVKKICSRLVKTLRIQCVYTTESFSFIFLYFSSFSFLCLCFATCHARKTLCYCLDDAGNDVYICIKHIKLIITVKTRNVANFARNIYVKVIMN